MFKFDENISNKLNRLKKRPKYQSSSTRHKVPAQMSFQFKSSLFTEKNRSVIEKLISQSVSPENSFSNEEIQEKENEKKEKEKEKEKEKKEKKEKEKEKEINKTSPKPKNKNSKATHNSKIANQRLFQDINNHKKKVFCKKILKNKNSTTFSYMNYINSLRNNDNSSITNCRIEPIKKRNYKFKISNNNSIEKRKIVFNGLGNNKVKNNSVKAKLDLNKNNSIKCLYERKKLNTSVKIGNHFNKRNSTNGKNNYKKNPIIVNTTNLKKRINNINNLKLVESKNKSKIIVNQKYRNAIKSHN